MKNLMIQGTPQSGKTTLVQFLIDRIDQTINGFYSKEIRDTEGRRIGFDIIDIPTFSSVPLARKFWNYPQTVGSYSVDVHAFANYLSKLDINGGVVVIDEIGKMQMLYNDFLDWVGSYIHNDEYTVIGTLPNPFPEILRKHIARWSYDVINISSTSRGTATEEALRWVKHFKVT